MPRLSAGLSPSSLNRLLGELEAYQEKLDRAPARLNALLMETGKEVIEQTVSGIRDPIGNQPGRVSAEQDGAPGAASAALSYAGPQVSYIEYGTGVTGQAAPHPKAGEAGWRYGSGKKIRLSGYWSYYDRMKGKYRSTKGIAAQMPVLKAALEMRVREAEKGREAMK